MTANESKRLHNVLRRLQLEGWIVARVDGPDDSLDSPKTKVSTVGGALQACAQLTSGGILRFTHVDTGARGWLVVKFGTTGLPSHMMQDYSISLDGLIDCIREILDQ